LGRQAAPQLVVSGEPDERLVRRRNHDPLVADVSNFYKVEKWTWDGMKVDSLLYAGKRRCPRWRVQI
jgi:hypothetical protein